MELEILSSKLPGDAPMLPVMDITLRSKVPDIIFEKSVVPSHLLGILFLFDLLIPIFLDSLAVTSFNHKPELLNRPNSSPL